MMIKPCTRNRMIISLLSILFILSSIDPLFSPGGLTLAEIPPDENLNTGGNGTAEFSGTWYIDSGQVLTRANQTLNLSGDIIINSTGRLVLTNFTLNMNNSFDGEFFILVKPGGTLELMDNSSIASMDGQYSYSIIVQPNGTLILDSSTIRDCGWRESDPGIEIFFDPGQYTSSNSYINNVTITECYTGISVFNSSAGFSISNSSIYNNSVWGIHSAGGQVNLINNIFNRSGGMDSNGAGRVRQQYFLDIQVNDSVTQRPVSDAVVTVRDSKGSTGSVTSTDATGRSMGLNITRSVILNNGTAVVFTPHNVTIVHPDYQTGYAVPEPVMDSNKNIQVLLDANISKLSADRIVVETRPDGKGTWVGPRSFGVGDTTHFSCVAYNDTYGFIGPVNASWTISNDTLASVTPTGTFTLFTVDPGNTGGTVEVTADFNGLTNRTGLLTIIKAFEDYITIMDMPGGSGSWVGPRSIPTHYNETFYCGVFNNTIGYIRDVNASWIVYNPYVGSIEPYGSSSLFVAIAEGETLVEASYLSEQGRNLTNRTGAITVSSFTVDSIMIRDRPGGAGSWVGPGTFDNITSLQFYCAGYNESWGYLYDVTVSWKILGDSVGTLIPSTGDSTELVITDSGEAYVQADLFGITNCTGSLRFTSPVPDFEVTGADIRFYPSDTELVESVWTTIQIKIRNRGGGINEDVELSVYNYTSADPEPDHLTTVILQPFDTFQTRTHNLSWKPDHVGSNTIVVYVDESDNILESNEYNNIAQRTLNVKPFLPDLVKIVVEPVNAEIKAGDVQQFIAVGHFEDNSSRPLKENEVKWSATGGAKINSTGHFFSLKAGTYNVTARSGLISNLTTVFVVPAELVRIEVFPNPYELSVGDTRKFVAYGYDEYYNRIDISPQWYTSGGGNISNDGEFYAEKEGVWLVFASVLDVVGNSTVTVNPSNLDLVKIMVFPSKVVVIKGHEFQFIAVGVDRNGKEHFLSPYWKTNGGGVISNSGNFNATDTGRWTVTATKAGTVGSADVIVDPGDGRTHIEKFIDPRTGVTVTASFAGGGTVWVNQLTGPGSSVTVPDRMLTMNRFYEITGTGDMILHWAFIEIPYNIEDLSTDQYSLESHLRLYVWNPESRQWELTGGSDVDMNWNIVSGNTTHLSLYAPMVDRSEIEQYPGADDDRSFMLIVAIIGFIIIVLVFFGILRFSDVIADRIYGRSPRREKGIDAGGLPVKPISTNRIKKKKKLKKESTGSSDEEDDLYIEE